MISAIGDLLPSALGVAISPVPIVAVILMLATPSARTNGSAFALGWVAGLTAVSIVVLVVADGSADADSSSSQAVDWIKLVLGALFLLMAAKQWGGRPKPGEPATLPKWMAAVDGFTPAKALGLGVLLSAANPKNLALTLASAASIAQAGLTTGDTAVAVIVFVVLGSLTVAGPVLFFLVVPTRAAKPLGEVKDLMSAHNAVIMMVVLLLLGAKMIGSGLAGITG